MGALPDVGASFDQTPASRRKSPPDGRPEGSSARAAWGEDASPRLRRRLLAGVVDSTDHVATVVGVPDAAGPNAVAAVVAVIVAGAVVGAVATVIVRAGQRRADGEAGQ